MTDTKFNLYEETRPNGTGQPHIQSTENDLLITVDFSKETFGEMVEKVRLIIQPLPSTTEVNIFILSGYNPHPDAGLFLDYVKGLDRSFNFFFRGIIHLEFLKLLLLENVFVHEGSKLKYDTNKTHEFQKQLMLFPTVFRNYFQRFIDSYNKLSGEIFMDVTEMKALGFTFQTY